MSKKDWNKICLQAKLGGLVDDELLPEMWRVDCKWNKMGICEERGGNGTKWAEHYSIILTQKGKKRRWISCFYPNDIDEENDTK